MKFLYSLLLSFAIFSCSNEKKDDAQKKEQKGEPVITIDSLLLTDSSWGPITGKTDYEGLQAIYGAANVKKARICGPECVDSIDVVLIYPETDKEIIVYWTDTTYKKIGSLENRSTQSPYYTSTGIKSGSTMDQLLKVNGQKINFSGFGWDYGGYIQSFNNGALEKSKVHYRLDLLEGGSEKLLGDVELNTEMPDVKKDLAKIQVWQLSLSLNE